MVSSGWRWRKPAPRDHWMGMDPDWWIGTDAEGRRWLVKMKGSFYAYREHVFASLAQQIGISCQSSTYLLIPSENVEPRRYTRNSEAYQLAIWLMDEHGAQSCSPTCPLATFFRQQRFRRIVSTRDLGIADIDDSARGDVLGHLCGQFEPHGHFFTRDHEYVVIDNECMFAEKPSLRQCRWVQNVDDRPMVREVCQSLVDISDEELRTITAVPADYAILSGRNLFDDLCAAKAAVSK